MAFKRLEGVTLAGNPRTLFRAIAINADQFKLVQEIVAHYNGETKLTRKQLRDAHGVLRGKKAAPYFVSKNMACKVKGTHGVYNVAVLKLAKGSAEITKPENEIKVPAPAKKESKPKREARGKREVKLITPVAEVPATVDAVETSIVENQ